MDTRAIKSRDDVITSILPAIFKLAIARWLIDICPAHFAAIKKLVDFKLIAQSKLRVAHDALFGVGAGVFETFGEFPAWSLPTNLPP